MNPIELCVSLLAPQTCFVCKNEGSALCAPCRLSFTETGHLLYLASNSSSAPVWAATDYIGIAKELVHSLKFNRGKESATVIASLLNSALPILPSKTVVSHVPTARRRIRTRGYDQAELIAKSFAHQRGLSYSKTLQRVTKTRQVGANRSQRSSQMKAAFRVYKPKRLHQKSILLIDDVMTTGATLDAASLLLQNYTDQTIYCAVFAYQPK